MAPFLLTMKSKNCYGIFIDISNDKIDRIFRFFLDKSLIFCILRVRNTKTMKINKLCKH